MGRRSLLVAIFTLAIACTGALAPLPSERPPATAPSHGVDEEPPSAPDDLLYLGRGPRQSVIVSAGDGRIVSRETGAYVTGAAFLPDRTKGFFLQRSVTGAGLTERVRLVDLRTGLEELAIDVSRAPERVHLPDVNAVPQLFSGATGEVVLLRTFAPVNDPGDHLVQLDRYDVRTGRRLGTRRWALPAARMVPSQSSPSDVHVAVAQLGDRGYLLRYTTWSPFKTTWHFIDPELRDIRSISSDRPGYEWLRANCAPEVHSLADRSGWLTWCSVEATGVPNTLVVIDRWFELSRVEFSRELGTPVAVHSSADGRVSLVTLRPALVRVDLRTLRVIDKRSITAAPRASVWPFQPRPALGKVSVEPLAQFSADGRTAYLASYDRSTWWSAIAIVDVATAAIRARVLPEEAVGGIHLSSDGRALYATTFAFGGKPELVTIDATSGSIRSRKVLDLQTLDYQPYTIAAVIPPGR